MYSLVFTKLADCFAHVQKTMVFPLSSSICTDIGANEVRGLGHCTWIDALYMNYLGKYSLILIRQIGGNVDSKVIKYYIEFF